MAAFSDSGWFIKGLKKLLTGSIDFSSDTFIIIPIYTTPDQTADEFVTDLDEINSPNARATLGTITLTEDTSNLRVTIDAADVSLDPINGSNDFLGYVLAKDTGSDATSPLLAWANTADITPNGGQIDITFNANGVASLDA